MGAYDKPNLPGRAGRALVSAGSGAGCALPAVGLDSGENWSLKYRRTLRFESRSRIHDDLPARATGGDNFDEYRQVPELFDLSESHIVWLLHLVTAKVPKREEKQTASHNVISL